jgi:hypothetical protein
VTFILNTWSSLVGVSRVSHTYVLFLFVLTVHAANPLFVMSGNQNCDTLTFVFLNSNQLTNIGIYPAPVCLCIRPIDWIYTCPEIVGMIWGTNNDFWSESTFDCSIP